MITHSISSTKQSPLDCDWLVEFLQPRNRAETDQMVEESQTAHMFSHTDWKKASLLLGYTRFFIL